MFRGVEDTERVRDLLMSLLSTSGTLAGISIGLASMTNARADKVATIADDLFVLCAAGFLIVCWLAVAVTRNLSSPRLRRWTNALDALFLGSLTLLVICGFLVVYEYI